MRYHHFCKVNNNCYKKQINTSCWETPGKVPNTLQLNCLHQLKNTNMLTGNCNLYGQHENMYNLYWLVSLEWPDGWLHTRLLASVTW